MKILILQYLQPQIDKAALEVVEHFYFLGLISRLAEDHILRFRLHPESRTRKRYRGLWGGVRFDNENRPLRESLEWPDAVICPAFSGAALEALMRKPTFMVLLKPHSCNLDYFRGAHLFTTLEAVHGAIKAGIKPDCSGFLERYTSRKEHPDPVRNIWRALAA